jgi:DNA-directed RNA polymerase subunit RPC12/RpoP
MSSGKVHHSTKVATTFPLQEEVEDGKNRHLVKCQRCPSKILNPGVGVYKQVEVTAVVRQWYNNAICHLIIHTFCVE